MSSNQSKSAHQSAKASERLFVDMANLFFWDLDERKRSKMQNVVRFTRQLNEIGYRPVIFVADPAFRHHVDNIELYDFFKNTEMIIEAPYGTKADIFILKLAKKYECKFLTNDAYKEYQGEFGKKWIFENSIAFIVSQGQIIIVERNL